MKILLFLILIQIFQNSSQFRGKYRFKQTKITDGVKPYELEYDYLVAVDGAAIFTFTGENFDKNGWLGFGIQKQGSLNEDIYQIYYDTPTTFLGEIKGKATSNSRYTNKGAITIVGTPTIGTDTFSISFQILVGVNDVAIKKNDPINTYTLRFHWGQNKNFRDSRPSKIDTYNFVVIDPDDETSKFKRDRIKTNCIFTCDSLQNYCDVASDFDHIYLGYGCIKQNPDIWNILYADTANTAPELHYGFDDIYNPKFIIFRLLGQIYIEGGAEYSSSIGISVGQSPKYDTNLFYKTGSDFIRQDFFFDNYNLNDTPVLDKCINSSILAEYDLNTKQGYPNNGASAVIDSQIANSQLKYNPNVDFDFKIFNQTNPPTLLDIKVIKPLDPINGYYDNGIISNVSNTQKCTGPIQEQLDLKLDLISNYSVFLHFSQSLSLDPGSKMIKYANPKSDTTVKFVLKQICDILCLTNFCNGPKLENCLKCYPDCLTCSGPSSSECESCVDPNKILVVLEGKKKCLDKEPAFENNVGTSGVIEFKYGLDITSEWLYIIILKYADTTAFTITQNSVTDSYSVQNLNSTPINLSNLFIISKTTSNNDKVVLIRKLDSKQPNSLKIQLLQNIIFTIQGGPNITILFIPYQDCHPDCTKKLCINQLENSCLQCFDTNKTFENQVPGKCVSQQNSGCTLPCITCKNGTPTFCLQCELKTHIPLNGKCVFRYPGFWNKITLGFTQMTLYYGFEPGMTNILDPSYMYFYLKGYNEGFLQIEVENTFTVQLYKKQGIQLIEKDGLTTYNLKVISGERSDTNVWDILFVANRVGGIPKVVDGTGQYSPIKLKFKMGKDDNVKSGNLNNEQQFFINFFTQKKCDSSCATCSGPEQYECLTCFSGFRLLSINTIPNRCIKTNAVCHINCATCFGPASNQCLECKIATLIPLDGLCVSKTPQFWNEVPLTPFNSTIYAEVINLQYGFSPNFEIIYFQFIFSNTIKWLGLGFTINNNKKNFDGVLIERVGSTNFILKDIYVKDHSDGQIPNQDIQDDKKLSYTFISSLITASAGKDSVIFARKMQTSDEYDLELGFTPNNITVVFSDQTFLQNHKGYFTSTLMRFRKKRVCNANCTSCIGPDKIECTSCIKGFSLSNKLAVSSECIVETIVCATKCATCLPTNPGYCTQCLLPSFLAFEGNCIEQVPQFPGNDIWNVIKVKPDFYVHYGFDEYFTRIYLKFIGKASGWVAIGFNSDMSNTDMILINDQLNNGTLRAFDMFSLGHSTPKQDSRQNVVTYFQTKDASNNIEVRVVRRMNTRDILKDTILDNNPRDLIFAFGNSYSFTKHSEYIIISNYSLSYQSRCINGCLACTGPLENQCTEFEEILVDDLSRFKIQEASSKLCFCLFSLLMIQILYFL